MIHLQHRIHIARPPAEVSAYVADLTNEQDWWTDVKNVRLLSGEAGTQGAKYERTFIAMGKERTVEVEVVQLEPGKHIVVQSGPGAVEVTGRMTMLSQDGGTDLVFAWDARTRGLARLMQPKIRRNTRRQLPEVLERLKQVLESRPPAKGKDVKALAKAPPPSAPKKRMPMPR